MWFEKGKIYRENRGLAALTSGNMVTPLRVAPKGRNSQGTNLWALEPGRDLI
jgi:hypothetical protein